MLLTQDVKKTRDFCIKYNTFKLCQLKSLDKMYHGFQIKY